MDGVVGFILVRGEGKGGGGRGWGQPVIPWESLTTEIAAALSNDGPKALVYLNNRIRMSVCVCVCLSVCSLSISR